MQSLVPPRSRSILVKVLCAFLVLLPFALVVYQINRYYVDVPFWDQWDFVPTLAKFYEGTLSIQDLWLQHNEHRLIFPRIILLGLARLSQWNVGYELAFSVLLALGIFAVLWFQVRSTERTLNVSLQWLVPILSVMVFSLTQGENWLWGWELQVFLNVLAAVAGLVLLHRLGSNWAFGGSLLLGFVATYSFANGVVYWIIGIASILVMAYDNKRLLTTRLIVWLGVAAFTIGSYLFDYHMPGHHPSIWLVLEEPLSYIVYVMVYLGFPITEGSANCIVSSAGCELVSAMALISSVLGLVVFIYLLISLIPRVKLRVLMPYVSFALYSIVSALITGVGRVGFGIEQAMSSRYISISSLLWVSLFVLLFIFVKTGSTEQIKRVAGCVTIVFLVGVVTLDSLQWRAYFVSRHEQLQPAQAELLSLKNDDLLRRLTHTPDYLRNQAAILERLRLSVYRNR